MYITSKNLNKISRSDLKKIEKDIGFILPRSYKQFLETFGTGTYAGTIVIDIPDERIKESELHDFWEHKNSPISKEEVGECLCLANSIDGDFLAMHKNYDGLILLPRYSEIITVFPIDKNDFRLTLNCVFKHLYNEDTASYYYFEPTISTNHKFMFAQSENIYHLIQELKSNFSIDYLVEDQYICKIFLHSMGGYVRFNLSVLQYGVKKVEVAIIYTDGGINVFSGVVGFLQRHGAINHPQ